jgi:hypothetical protein
LSRLIRYFKQRNEPEKDTELLAKEELVMKEPSVRLPFAPNKTVREDEVSKAKEQLKVSSLLKEITSYALTRLYEAQAEGKITEEERDQLTKKYKEELSQIEGKLNYNQSVIDLYKLEETQSELIGMFYEKINELNQRIDELRGNIAPKPVEIVVEEKSKEEAAVARAAPTTDKVKVKKPEPKPIPKSPTEQKIDAIRDEVLKLIEKLDKNEAET